MNTDKRSHFLGIKQLTLRSVLIGMLGSIIITASSMYVALKMSALPWPTIFVAVLSMALLKILGRTNINEINIAQTGMSAGAMVAGGLAFTLPGLWISGVYQPYDAATESISEWMLPKFWPILLIAVAGMILGSLCAGICARDSSIRRNCLTRLEQLLRRRSKRAIRVVTRCIDIHHAGRRCYLYLSSRQTSDYSTSD